MATDLVLDRVDTIRLDDHPNLLYVRLHAGGLTGLGETMFGPRAVEAYLHETVAPAILGRPVEPLEELTDGLVGYVGFSSSGAETRGNSAVDMALWDLRARSRGVPLHRLLGDAGRVDIPVYNTCAGPDYMRRGPEVAPRNWGIPGDPVADRYEDLDAFLHRADDLAESLLAQGIRGMKIWPFDTAAEASQGQYLSLADLAAALVPIQKVREAVGGDIDVMIELHGMWSVPMAQRIASALEELEPRWIEDPVRPHDFGALARVASSTSIPIAAGETLGGPATHQRMMDRGAVAVDIVDVGWAGGISAARRVATMAAERGLELALHDCTGPVGLAVATHLAVATPVVAVQEIVRAYAWGWYGGLVTDLPPIEDGRIRPPAGPGLGLDLRPELPRGPGHPRPQLEEAAVTPNLPDPGRSDVVERMRTLRIPSFANMVWLEVTTADGAAGTGEACLGALAIEDYLHETAAPYLLGRHAYDIERHDRALRGYVGYDGAGVETRGNGAVNLALWDLAGRVTGRPVYELLGGRSRDRIRAYNTCAGYAYALSGGQLDLADSGLREVRAVGPYEDLEAAIHRPAELARDLLAQGIGAMKIWPFDPAATASHGRSIDAATIRRAVEPLRAIREAVGDRMDIMVELHAQWQPEPMRAIVAALEEFRPLWLEDPIKAASPAELAALAASTSLAVAISETVAGRQRFKELLDAGALDILIFDVGWTGGITEARKIAALAEVYEVPVAPHDCTGPLLLAASAQLSIHLPNAMIQEHVRAFTSGWYAEVVEDLPPVRDGFMSAPDGPGLGSRLRPEAWERPDAVIRVSEVPA